MQAVGSWSVERKSIWGKQRRRARVWRPGTPGERAAVVGHATGFASEAPQVSSIQRRKCLHLAAKFFFPLEQYSLRYCVCAFFTHSFRFC